MKTSTDPIISYVDTTVGGVFFNVTPSASPEVTKPLLEANRRRRESQEGRQEYAIGMVRLVEAHHYPLVVHEWAHILQAVTFPALYLRCLREFNYAFMALEQLRGQPNEFPIPLQVAEEWIGVLRISTQPFRVRISEEGEPKLEEPSPKWIMPNDLSETDLLEDGASIFQYKVEIGGEGSADGYRRWLNEGYRYSKTFDLLAEFLSPQDAYIALPGLVRVAYATNWPVNSFTALLAMTIKHGSSLPSAMGTDSYCDFLEEVQEASLPEEMPEPARRIGEEPRHARISDDSVRELAERWPHHPITPLVEHAWGKDENIARLREAMLHPYRAFNRRKRKAEEWLEFYRPPLMSFRLLSPEMTIRDTVAVTSPTLIAHDGPRRVDMDWVSYLIELLRVKAFAFSMATPIAERYAHNCPHRECGYHPYGLCRRWNFIPPKASECGFPDWLEQSTLHRLDFDKDALIPVGDRKETG